MASPASSGRLIQENPCGAAMRLSIVAKRLVSEASAEVIGLLPQFIVRGKEGDQIGRDKSQRLGSLADTRLVRLQRIKDHARGRPEAGILAAHVEPAFR